MHNTGIFSGIRFEYWVAGFEEKLARTLLNDSHFRNQTTFSVISGQLETTLSFPPRWSGMRMFA